MFSNKWRVQQHIYLQDYRRHSVAVSQEGNGRMQVYINIMEDKYNFFICNVLMVNELAGPTTSPGISEINSFSCGVAHRGESLISVFQEFSASMNKFFNLVGVLGTRLSFYGV